VTLVFEKNANFFCRKLAKIAEHYDHNIGPRFGFYDSISVVRQFWVIISQTHPATQAPMLFKKNIFSPQTNGDFFYSKQS
jgi:hypothetical protein